MTIYKYPLKAPVDDSGNENVEAPTGAIDYLCLKRSRIIYNNSDKKNAHQFDPSQSSLTGVQRKRMDGCVYLAMPPQLSTSYQAAYSHQDVGLVGLGMAEAWGKDNMDNIVDQIQSAAGMGVPEFASTTATGLANAFSGMLGLAGKVDANSLQQMSKGRVFNPFAEQIFKSMAFRQHQFNFKLLARSEKEAEEIQRIITWIKAGATPEIQGVQNKEDGLSGLTDGTLTASVLMKGDKELDKDSVEKKKKVGDAYRKLLDKSMAQRFFKVPDHFDLKFLRVKPGDENNWWNPAGGTDFQEGTNTTSMHFKIHSSFCNNIGVNYTPDGQYTSFKSIKTGRQIQVPAIALSLQFIETRLVSKHDVLRGY